MIGLSLVTRPSNIENPSRKRSSISRWLLNGGQSLLLWGALGLAGCREPELERADLLLQLEDWPRAIALYDHLVEKDPSRAEARMGLALARAGREREAAEASLDSASRWLSVARDFAIVERLDSALSTSHDRADALFQAALCWQREGRIPQARNAAEQAQATLAPHAPSAQYLGTLARSEGDAVAAERWFTRAIAADSAYLPAWASLGELAEKDGDPEGALLYWEEGLRRSPGQAWFQQSVQRLRDSLGLSTP